MTLRAWFLAVVLAAAGGYLALPLFSPWPPKLGEPFPDVEFVNYDGRTVRISDFKGKVVLIEPVGMTCPACNAFSGGNKVGGIGKVTPQRSVMAIADALERRGTPLGTPDLVFVQLLLYDLSMGAPTVEDARIWAEHFRFEGGENVYVVVPASDLRGKASFKMIPGFFLLDKNSVIRFDATGHRPTHGLYGELLPSIPRFLSE